MLGKTSKNIIIFTIICTFIIPSLSISVFGNKVTNYDKTSILDQNLNSLNQESIRIERIIFDQKNSIQGELGEIDITIDDILFYWSPNPSQEIYPDKEILNYQFSIYNVGDCSDQSTRIEIDIYLIYPDNTEPQYEEGVILGGKNIDKGKLFTISSLTIKPKNNIPDAIKFVIECNEDVNSENNIIIKENCDLGVTISGYVKHKNPISANGGTYVQCDSDISTYNEKLGGYTVYPSGFYFLCPPKNDNNIPYSYTVTCDKDGEIKTIKTRPLRPFQ